MKIVYIIESLGNSGGMERVLCTKANWLSEFSNYQITIITLRPLPKDNFFNFNPNINIVSLDIKEIPGPLFLKFFKKKIETSNFKKTLSKFLKNIRPDFTISMYGSEYSFLHKIDDGSRKLVEFHFSHNYLEYLIKSIPDLKFRGLRLWYVKLMQRKERKYAAKYDGLILLTDQDRKLWGNRDNMYVIPNPNSFSSNYTASLQNKRIIAIGRFISQKGFDLLIKSFTIVGENFPDWKLTIIGEGQDEDFLRKLIQENKLDNQITLKSPTKAIEKELLNSSILAFPSRYEGFGLVLTEAMECGVPCVAFDCECGPAEIIKHQEDGLLIKSEDIKAFADALIILITDSSLRQQMGTRAKINVGRFKEDRIMRSWVALFNELHDLN